MIISYYLTNSYLKRLLTHRLTITPTHGPLNRPLLTCCAEVGSNSRCGLEFKSETKCYFRAPNQGKKLTQFTGAGF